MTPKNKEIVKKVEKKQKPHEEEFEALVKFGLSENEVRVYLYLLERGEAVGGTKIAQGTSIHRQYVYFILPKLIEIGLVEEILVGKWAKYIALSPSHLEKIARKRVYETESLIDNLNKISKVGHDQDFEIVVGNKRIRDYQMEFVDNAVEGEIQYIIAGSSRDFLNMMGDEYSRMLKIQEGKKFSTFVIGKKEDGEVYVKYKASKVNFQTLYVDGLPEKLPQFTIRKNEVLLYSYFNPPMLYVIKSKDVAEKFKEFFFLLWRTFGGEEIK